MATSRDRLLSSTDIQFLLTFAAGMAGFWLSGRLPALIPVKTLPHNGLVVYAISLGAALIVYGLGMALWNTAILGPRRARRPVLVSALLVAALALISSLTLSQLTARLHLAGRSQLALLTFGLYLVYGLYYVIGWAVARRLARD